MPWLGAGSDDAGFVGEYDCLYAVAEGQSVASTDAAGGLCADGGLRTNGYRNCDRTMRTKEPVMTSEDSPDVIVAVRVEAIVEFLDGLGIAF